jgi:ribonuclease J
MNEELKQKKSPVETVPSLKIYPLGGTGEVTKNMYLYELGDDQLVVDCGIGFPTHSMLGVDLLIPDVSYIEQSGKKLHGIVLTHGHEDHIGGLPYILPRLPKNLPIFGSTLTIALAERKVREFGLTNPMKVVEDHLVMGPFDIDFIHITHSIPNCKHLHIKTPAGNVYHGADFKFDLNPPDGFPPDFAGIARAAERGIDLMLSDCLRVEKDGFTLPERKIEESFDREMRTSKGKFIMTTIGSSVSRISMAINVAGKYGRKVAFVGRSIEQNMMTAIRLGFTKMPQGALIKPEQIKRFKDNELCLIVSGSQGQEGSSMARAAAGEHNNLKLRPGDKVVISSDTIPGNENNVSGIIDTLVAQGVDVVYSGVTDNLHVSGHGYRGELELLIRLARPKYMYPIGGNIRHQFRYRKAAVDLGYNPEDVVIPMDAEPVILTKKSIKLGKPMDLKNIYVDGLGIGDVGTVVLRDRQAMASDGVLIIIVPIAKFSGKVAGEIEVVSRGFVYMKQSAPLINEIKAKVQDCLKKNKGVVTDWNYLRNKIEEILEMYIYKQTERRPLILPVVVEV